MAKNKVDIGIAGTEIKLGGSKQVKISAKTVESKVDSVLVSRLKHAVRHDYDRR